MVGLVGDRMGGVKSGILLCFEVELVVVWTVESQMGDVISGILFCLKLELVVVWIV